MPLDIDSVLGRRVRIAGHFAGVVRIEAVDDLDGAYEIRVRTEDGRLDETFLEVSEVESGAIQPIDERTQLASGDDLFDLVEARRIDLAFTHDPNFAVSLSGIRGLPHQITAVYRHMLPQARLRFVLADDPGAGKTIMAGLLMKELHLRGVADRVLILCPAPLTVQWQDELLDKFDEHYEVLDSHKARWQLGGNAWQQTDRAIASLGKRCATTARRSQSSATGSESTVSQTTALASKPNSTSSARYGTNKGLSPSTMTLPRSSAAAISRPSDRIRAASRSAK